MSRLARLEQVRVDLGGRTILEDIDFEVGSGQVVGVTGPNGSGKTTLLRVLATLIRIDGGTGEVLGADITGGLVFGVRSKVGLIGHSPALLSSLTLRENLEHAARLSGAELSRVDRALRAVGLEKVADRSADTASFGMNRRLEVARLLLTDPRLLLLDEALSGLDAEARDLIDALIERTVDDGGGVVAVSHDESHLGSACQVISRLASGRLEATA